MSDKGFSVSGESPEFRYTPEKLQKEYGIKREAYYDRLKKLGIKARKKNGRSYLTPDQVRRLDDLHDFLATGKSIGEFIEMENAIESVEPDESSSLAVADKAAIATNEASATSGREFNEAVDSVDRYARSLDQRSDSCKIDACRCSQ